MPSLDMAKLSSVLTTQDRQEMLGHITEAQASVFSVGSQSTDKAKELEEMRTTLLALPVIRLTLAFEPKRVFIEKIVQTITAEREGSSFVVDVEIDPEVIAGVMISERGAVIDKTLKKKLLTVDLQPIINVHLQTLHSL